MSKVVSSVVGNWISSSLSRFLPHIASVREDVLPSWVGGVVFE